MSAKCPPLVKLTEHCAALTRVLYALSQDHPVRAPYEGEEFEWRHAAEWLDVAASIVKVDVVTAQGDLSVAYCESVADYENSRSELYSKLVKALAVFTFVWDAYEIIAKIVNPPSIPIPDRKSGNDRLTARVAFCLRSAAPNAAYRACLSHFQHFLAYHSDYTALGNELSTSAEVV